MRVLGSIPAPAAAAAPSPDNRDPLTKAGEFVQSHDLPGSTIGRVLGDNIYGLGRLAHGDFQGFSDAANQAGNEFEQVIGDTLRSMALPATLAVTGGGSLLGDAATFGASGAAQGAGNAMVQGKDAKGVFSDAAKSAAINSALGAGSHVLGAASRYVSNNLPTRLLRDLAKQSKTELRAGKDVAPTILADKRVGTMEGLIGDAQSNIENLGNQIKSKLAQGTDAGVTIQRDDLLHQVAQSFNADGAALDKKQVANILEGIAPQARGLLAKQTLTLSEANQLRSALDKTLGDKNFLKAQLPFTKDVLKEFSGALRETVKQKGPAELRQLFADQSKEIRLRDVLNEAAIADSRKNIVSWRDILSGGIGGAFGGIPGIAAAVAMERSLTSAPFLTGTAVGIDSTSKVMRPILQKLSPAERALITTLVSRGVAGGSQQPGNQPQQTPATQPGL